MPTIAPSATKERSVALTLSYAHGAMERMHQNARTALESLSFHVSVEFYVEVIGSTMEMTILAT
jgi:hypothetical protein